MAQRSFLVLVGMPCLALLLASCVGRSQDQSDALAASREDILRSALQDYVGREPLLDSQRPKRYFEAFFDLNGDGKDEAIVHLIGRSVCGSGGCPTLVLTPAGTSYEVVGYTLIANPPVRVLARSSNGWRSLAVQVRGGGVRGSYEAELPFDGRSYPRGAANPPSRPLEDATPGEVVIPRYDYGEGDKLLFEDDR